MDEVPAVDVTALLRQAQDKLRDRRYSQSSRFEESAAGGRVSAGVSGLRVSIYQEMRTGLTLSQLHSLGRTANSTYNRLPATWYLLYINIFC